MDAGTENEPLEIECPECDGLGCDACSDGSIRIDGCPNVYCSTIAPVINIIELFEKGLPPIVGGVLDQSASFLTAAKFYDHEEQLAKAERSE